MMTLTKELVEEFRERYFAKFGEQLSYGEAERELKDIAELVRITSTKEEFNYGQSTNH